MPTYQAEGAALDIDETNHVIRGVKVLGFNSKQKGRRYPKHVVEAAIKLYGDAAVNVNHPGEKDLYRNYDDRMGWIDNPRVTDCQALG